jgi:hypothetical protein
MDQIELYKGFRIRASEEWSGQWLAEAKKPFDTDAECIATPPVTQRHTFIKQMIDSPSTTIKAPKMIQ